MYTIYADDICIYNDMSPLEELRLISPELVLEDSAAGSLTLTIPYTNVGYSLIQRLTTDITVFKEGNEIWSGRVIEEDRDFQNSRKIYCEGELAFLCDSTQPQAEYHDISPENLLRALIGIHNSKVEERKRFEVGVVTVTDPNDSLYRYTNYESTLECINEKLIERLGGHIRIRKENGTRYIDYISDYPNINAQVIEFGKNLMDFTRNWSLTDFATVILPLGKRLENGNIESLEAYTTVEEVNGGDPFVASTNAVSLYGRIEKVVHWDDVSSPSNLLRKARRYLSDIQFEDLTIELSAVDLHYYNIEYEDIKLLDSVRVLSVPHGMDRYFPVKKMSIPLDTPENTVFSLGSNIKTELTSVSNKISVEIKESVNNDLMDIRQEFKAADGRFRSSIEGIVNNYVTNTTLTQTVESITTEVNRKVNGSDFGTYMQQNYEAFLLGFNNASGNRVIKISRNGIDIFNGTDTTNNNRLISLGSSGMSMWYSGQKIGVIGTTSWTGYPNCRGLHFGLEYDGQFMSWGRETLPDSPSFSPVLMYARSGNGVFQNEGLYLGCDLYAQNHTISNANLTNVRANGNSVYTGQRTIITHIGYNAQGDLEWTESTFNISNGMFTN